MTEALLAVTWEVAMSTRDPWEQADLREGLLQVGSSVFTGVLQPARLGGSISQEEEEEGERRGGGGGEQESGVWDGKKGHHIHVSIASPHLVQTLRSCCGRHLSLILAWLYNCVICPKHQLTLARSQGCHGSHQFGILPRRSAFNVV